MLWFVDKATRGQADLQDPRLGVVGKARLQGLPPMTVVSAELDPLRSEGKTLARRLQEAGVAVERRNHEGVTHGFFGMAPAVAGAQAAQTFVGERLRAALGGRSCPRALRGIARRRGRAAVVRRGRPGTGPCPASRFDGASKVATRAGPVRGRLRAATGHVVGFPRRRGPLARRRRGFVGIKRKRRPRRSASA
jgi:hypothetical protein